MTPGYHADIEVKTKQNKNFREVLYTGQYSQLVVMSFLPGDETGLETHTQGDQFIRVESGEGLAILDEEEIRLTDGVAVIVPAGVEHNLVNTSSDKPLQLYTVYSPPEHPAGIVHKTLQDAEQSESNHKK